MDQQITDSNNGITRLVTNIDLHHCAVFFCHNSVQRQWQRYPLIFLDTPIVMGVQKHQILILIHGILLNIQTGRVDMCTQNIHSFTDRLLTNDKHCQRFPHMIVIYFVAGL